MVLWLETLLQIDHCEESLMTPSGLSRLADSKVPAPRMEVVEVFHSMIIKTCARNYKKRCLMDEVLHRCAQSYKAWHENISPYVHKVIRTWAQLET